MATVTVTVQDGVVEVEDVNDFWIDEHHLFAADKEGETLAVFPPSRWLAAVRKKEA